MNFLSVVYNLSIAAILATNELQKKATGETSETLERLTMISFNQQKNMVLRNFSCRQGSSGTGMLPTDVYHLPLLKDAADMSSNLVYKKHHGQLITYY
jgi:hypothetical protein